MLTGLKMLWQHPDNRGHRLSMFGRWFAWNVRKRLSSTPKVIPLFGFEFVGHPDCNVAHRLMFIKGGLFEYDEMSFFRRFVSPGDTIVDIGAHVGALSLLFASLAPEGRVVSVEPTPGSFERLCENLDRNDLRGRVTAVNKAMGLEEGAVAFQTSAATTHNRIIAGQVDDVGRIQIPCTTLDRLAEETGLDHVDFIKVDTEGFEESVILGGRGFFERLRPKAMLFEANGLCFAYGSDLSKAMAMLESLDYRFGLYGHDAFTIRLITGKVPPRSPESNYFAFSRPFLDALPLECTVVEVDGGALASEA